MSRGYPVDNFLTQKPRREAGIDNLYFLSSKNPDKR
jgi:hypothetical protein